MVLTQSSVKAQTGFESLPLRNYVTLLGKLLNHCTNEVIQLYSSSSSHGILFMSVAVSATDITSFPE